VSVVAIDGKVQANAAPTAHRGYEQIAREILAEAAGTDPCEDAGFRKSRRAKAVTASRVAGFSRRGTAKPSRWSPLGSLR
jgi:hypothetical protein